MQFSLSSTLTLFYSGQNSLQFSLPFTEVDAYPCIPITNEKDQHVPLYSWWYFQIFQSVVLRFQKHVAIQAVQGVIFPVCHPCHSILFLHSCPVLSMAPQLTGHHKDTNKQPEAGEGTERKISNGRSSARHHCKRFPATAWSISSMQHTLTTGTRHYTSHHKDLESQHDIGSYSLGWFWCFKLYKVVKGLPRSSPQNSSFLPYIPDTQL